MPKNIQKYKKNIQKKTYAGKHVEMIFHHPGALRCVRSPLKSTKPITRSQGEMLDFGGDLPTGMLGA